MLFEVMTIYFYPSSYQAFFGTQFTNGMVTTLPPPPENLKMKHPRYMQLVP